MPLYHYICPVCGRSARKILENQKRTEQMLCECGQKMKRDPHPPTSRAIETIDNGFMPRAVEKLVDAQRLLKERAAVRKRRK